MLLTTAGRTRYYIILLYAISFANNNKPNWVRLLRTITTTTTTTTTKSLLQKKKKKKKNTTPLSQIFWGRLWILGS